MNWKLAKSIYIVVFLLFNIGLGYILYQRYTDSATVSENTVSILEAANIRVENVEEVTLEEMSTVTATNYDFTSHQGISSDDNHRIRSGGTLIDYQIDDETIAMDLEILNTFKNDEVFRGREYRYHAKTSDETHQRFVQYYNDFPIFDTQEAMIVMNGDGHLESYTQGYLTSFEENRSIMTETLVNPYRLIESMYHRDYIESGTTVKSMTLGYTSVKVEGNQMMLRPSWQVIVTNNSQREMLYYVDALNMSGEIRESE